LLACFAKSFHAAIAASLLQAPPILAGGTPVQSVSYPGHGSFRFEQHTQAAVSLALTFGICPQCGQANKSLHATGVGAFSFSVTSGSFIGFWSPVREFRRSDAGSRRVVDEGFPSDKRVHRAVLDHALDPFLEAQASSVQTFHCGIAGRVHQHRPAPVVADCAAVRFRRQMRPIQILRQREGLAEPAPTALQFVLVVEFAHFFFPLIIRSAVAGVIITPPPPFAAGTFTSTVRSCPHREHVTRPFAAMMSDTFTLSVSARHFGQRSCPVSGRTSEPPDADNPAIASCSSSGVFMGGVSDPGR